MGLEENSLRGINAGLRGCLRPEWKPYALMMKRQNGFTPAGVGLSFVDLFPRLGSPG
jgi:hypothetical protein